MGATNTPPDFGQYRFLRQLGEGADAGVYEVEHTSLGIKSVIKISNPILDANALARFKKEALLLANLQHPNILQARDFGTMPDGRPFLVTEWVEGTPLSNMMGSRFPVSDVLDLSEAIASALGYAHRQGVLHRDVKPENILVPQRGGFAAAKLLDFGVFGQLESDTGMTRAGFVVGTPYYMSPEQLRGEALTPAVDVFALGVVMYQMLTGKRPFERNSIEQIFSALLYENPAPLGPDVSEPVRSLVFRCLSKNPLDRPRNGNELVELIEQARRLDVYSKPEITGTYDAVSHIQTPPPAAPMASASRSSAPMIAIGVIAGLILAVGLMWFMTQFTKKGSLSGPVSTTSNNLREWLFIGLGVLIAVAGLAIAAGVRRYAASKRDQLSSDISDLLDGAKTRKALSMTLSLQVDEVIKKCRLMDEKFLGLTMAVMVREYSAARKFDDRQKALMNAITILDKLGPKLSPWYIRHEKLIAAGVSLVGIISGLATAAQSAAKIVKGVP